MASAAALRWVQVVQEDTGANPNAAADGIDAANNRATAAAAAHAAAKIQRQLLVRLRVVIMADFTTMGAMVHWLPVSAEGRAEGSPTSSQKKGSMTCSTCVVRRKISSHFYAVLDQKQTPHAEGREQQTTSQPP